jgi:adenylate cyclase class IV
LGPKLSAFNILEISDGALMEQMLTESVGLLGVLDKTRYLFVHENRTRIHLDIVKNANGSDFFAMEFEVMLDPKEEITFGNQIAEDLMKTFHIKSDQLLEGSYFETLNN